MRHVSSMAFLAVFTFCSSRLCAQPPAASSVPPPPFEDAGTPRDAGVDGSVHLALPDATPVGASPRIDAGAAAWTAGESPWSASPSASPAAPEPSARSPEPSAQQQVPLRPVLPVPWLGFVPSVPPPAAAPPSRLRGASSAAPSPSTSTGHELTERLRELFPVRPRMPGGGWVWLLPWALSLWVLGSVLGRLARGFSAEGLLPGLLEGLRLLLRVVAVVFVLVAVGRSLPPSVRPALPWALLAAAAAVGWSARDVLPDLVAGVLLVTERRIRPGRWVGGDGFAGTVERVGLRASTLRDSLGRRVTVPNRHLLSVPLIEGRAVGGEHEVQLRLPEHCVAADVRAALRDAVLLSPWVPPGADPVVLRDPVDRALWTVRAPLLEVRWAARFEGELLERAEELLVARPGCEETSQAIERPEAAPRPR